MLTRRSTMVGACLLAVAVVACGDGERPAPSANAAAAPSPPRRLGEWEGRGNTTLGFVSESGSFRISWIARNEDSSRPGSFHLLLRSGISGRPLRVIADHSGAGGGSVEFGDEPRLYEFLVEASGIDWHVSVDETFATRSSSGAPPEK